MDRTAESTDSPAVSWLRQPLLLAVVLAFVACFAGIGSHHLWSPDEPTGAAVGREMLESGDLIVPRLNGQPFLEKPPLYWWVQTAVLRHWGVTAPAARLPSALFSALTLLVTFALGRRLGGRRSGLLAAAVLGCTALFVLEAQRVVVDPALAFFVALSHLGFVILVDPRTPAERRRALLLIAVAVPLAFLSKGVVGVGLAVVPPALWLLVTRRRRALRDLVPLALLGIPVFALFVVPWAAALVRAGGWPALQECLLNNTVQRLSFHARGTVYGHTRPILYYLAIGPAVLLPWSLAIPAMLRTGVLRFAPNRPGSEARSLLFGTFAIGILLLSAAASKRELYLLPLLPAFAACVASWLDGVAMERNARARRWDRTTLVALVVLAALLPLVLWLAALAVEWTPPARGARIGLLPLQAALTPGILIGFGLAAAGACGLLLAALVRYRRSGPGAQLSPLWVALPFLLLFLVVETAIQAAVDPAKSMSDMTAAVSRLLPGNDPVPAYLPPKLSPESVYGIISFDLGRRTLPLSTPDQLRAWIEQKPGARVVLRADEASHLPADLLGRAVILYDERGRKASPFVIADWNLALAARR
ncbi:MAG: glycosyltransferase family 39 protein [Thermoanaerobaculia bacterium]